MSSIICYNKVRILEKELNMDYYIGIDLGTSSVKLMLVDSAGEIKNTVTREYPVSYPRIAGRF